MKKENIVSTVFGLGVILCITGFIGKDRKRKDEPKQTPSIIEEAKPKEPNDGKELVRNIMIDLLRKPGEWKNERDYLEKLTKKFIEEAKELDWMNELPVSQDELWTTLEEEKLLGTFEIELEKKYKRQN